MSAGGASGTGNAGGTGRAGGRKPSLRATRTHAGAGHLPLQGALTLVTGATGGLGQAIAGALHQRGCRLVLTGRRADILQRLATQFDATTVVADLAQRADVDRVMNEAGDVDILVANAGLPGSGAVLDYSPDEIDRALDVNLRAPIQMARFFGERMLERGRGHIVLMGSLSGLAATAGSGIYSATKFGLRGFAHGLRQDLHGTGVGVSIVLPGFVREAGMFAEAGARLPFGVRTVTPAQVAAGVLEAIERDRAEVPVAPAELLGGARFATVAPGLAAAGQRLMGAQRVSRDLAEGQRHKR